MTSLRQKPKLSFEAPVLFRLPDLRIHRSHETSPHGSALESRADRQATALPARDSASTLAGTVPQAGLPARAEQTFRVDQPQAQAALASHAAPSHWQPSQPVAAAAATVPTQSATSGVTASGSPEPVSATNAALHPAVAPVHAARGWMERFGSRLILIITLLVIMTAAWVTGQRMPASKPTGVDDLIAADATDSDSLDQQADDKLATNAGSTSLADSSPQSSTSNAELDLNHDSTSDGDSVPDSHSNVAAKPAMESRDTADLASSGTTDTSNSLPPQPSPDLSAILALEAPRTVYEDDTPPVTNATGGATELPSLPANSDPSSGSHAYASPTLTTPVQSVAHDLGSKLPADTGRPAMNLAPATGDQGFYSGSDKIEALPQLTPAQPAAPVEAAVATNVPSSHTPNQLKMDPNVLVPWANEQALSRERQQSPTPNPVRNWADYLPVDPSNVKAVSATVDPAQVQVGMPAMDSSPAYGNSYYTN